MSYQAIYRQWRPKKFSDVLGQDAVIATLKNQINSGHIAHAYLFSGMRGTGKTSTARILARSLNCIDLSDSEPCNKCQICLEILNETMIDVVEIDAASNNGVDDIRQIRETIKYPPTQTKYKIYIIDEVHMLSQGAFNALLKTLEEPPEYVVFILATTEPQKIPATILSRCQRYDFKSISKFVIVEHLNKICSSLNIKANEKALQLIADNSGGALRDSQSLLEQVLGNIDNTLEYENVVNMLGIMNEGFFIEFMSNIFKSDISGVLESLERFISDGGRIDALIHRLLEYYRHMIFIKSNVDISTYKSDFIETNDEFLKYIDNLSIETILWSMELLANLSTQIKWISQPRIHFEMLLIKLMVPKTDKNTDAIFARLDKLETGVNIANTTKNHDVIDNDLKKRKIFIEKDSFFQNNKRDDVEINDTGKMIKSEDIQSDFQNDNQLTNNSPTVDFEIIKSQWQSILSEIKAKKIQVQAFLLEGELYSLEDNKLTIKFSPEYEFHANMLSEPKNNLIIQKVLNKRFSTNFVIKCICEDISNLQNKLGKISISNEDKLKDFLGEYTNKLNIE